MDKLLYQRGQTVAKGLFLHDKMWITTCEISSALMQISHGDFTTIFFPLHYPHRIFPESHSLHLNLVLSINPSLLSVTPQR